MTIIGDGPAYEQYMATWIEEHPDPAWHRCPRCSRWNLGGRVDPCAQCPPKPKKPKPPTYHPSRFSAAAGRATTAAQHPAWDSGEWYVIRNTVRSGGRAAPCQRPGHRRMVASNEARAKVTYHGWPYSGGPDGDGWWVCKDCFDPLPQEG